MVFYGSLEFDMKIRQQMMKAKLEIEIKIAWKCHSYITRREQQEEAPKLLAEAVEIFESTPSALLLRFCQCVSARCFAYISKHLIRLDVTLYFHKSESYVIALFHSCIHANRHR